MGKACNWLRCLLRLQKSDPNSNPGQKLLPEKRRSFAESYEEKDSRRTQQGVADCTKPTVPVTTAPVAAVVNLKSGERDDSAVGNGLKYSMAVVGRSTAAGHVSREELAAVMIQAHFRAYLSRRALRALRALVKLQALVRGHLLRKQTADILRRMEALVQAQARARAGRILLSGAHHSNMKSSHFNYTGPATPEKFEHMIRARNRKHQHQAILKRNGSKSSGYVVYDSNRSHLSRNWSSKRSGIC